jgi:hypothetical protein
MKSYLLLILILCCITLKAQTYHPFPTKNAMWTEMYLKPIFDDSPRNVFHGYRIKDQDTTINGKHYFKIFHFYNPDFSDEKLCGGIREVNKRVYYYVIDSLSYIGDLDYLPLKTEFLLYDFSLNVGDSISSDTFRITLADYPGYLKFIKIDSVQFGNEYYRTFQFGRQFSLNPVHEPFWIEGIGTFNGLLYPIGDKCECGSGSTLICFSKENNNIYHNQYFKDCNCTAQKSFPELSDHPEWNVQRSIEPSLPGPVFIMSYHMEKDTAIYGKTYSLVSGTGNQQPHLSYERVGFVRTDSKKVFFKKLAEGKEYLLYDFGLQIGDTAYFPFFETDSAKYHVLNVDSVNVNGIKRLRLKVLPEYYPEEYMSMYWIEGIGSLWNPFYHDSFGVGGKSDEVHCVSTDAGQLYANPNYDDCTTVLQKTDCIVSEGFVWSGMIIYKDPSGNDSISSYHIKFEGDTILNNRTYTKIWQSNDSQGINWYMTGLIREVEKRVYYHKLNDDGFYDMLLYDFSVKKGSSLLLSSIESPEFFESMKVTSVDSVIVNGVKRLRIQLSDGTDSDTWIEKIGSLQGIINHCYFETDSNKRILLCVKQDGEMIYSNDAYSECFYTQSSFPTFSTDLRNLKINIYPNPFTNEITIEYPGTEPFTIEILNSVGQKVFENNVPTQNRFQVNLSAFPAGMYFVKVTSGKKVMVQKIIRRY